MKHPKTLLDLKLDPRVHSVHQEYDGYGDTDAEEMRPSYWVGLNPGFSVAPHGTNSIHTKTIKEACRVLRENVTQSNLKKGETR